MASIIKYFKKKIKPLKRCVGSSGQSFERNNRLASITRNSKSNGFDEDFSKSQMTEYNNDYSRVSAKPHKRPSRISVFTGSSGDQKKQQKGIMLFRKHNTENSLTMKSTSYFGSPEKTTNTSVACNFQTPTAPYSSPTTNYSISMYSNDQYQQQTTTNVGQQQNSVKSASNDDNNNNRMTMTMSNNNNELNERKTNSVTMNPSATASTSIDLIVQQSTPFNEGYQSRGRKRSLRIQPRDDVNSEPLNTKDLLLMSNNNKNQALTNSNLNTPQVSSIEIDDRKASNTSPNLMVVNTNFNKNKCRRSITTYTSSDNKKNRIIDYFNQMDLKSNQKISTKIRSKSAQRRVANEEETMNNTANEDTEDEIEKIQDAFFIDDSIVNNSREAKNKKYQQQQQRKAKRASIDSLHSSAITINESSSVAPNVGKREGEKFAEHFASKHNNKENQNHHHQVNSSIERMRRSISMPGLNHENNTTIFSNLSKISMIKDIEEEHSIDLLKEKSSPQQNRFNDDSSSIRTGHHQTQTTMNDNEKLFSSRQSINSTQPSSYFVRGQPQTRMSRNIKDMFKNVVKYQMNALNCLEKFYESQINKLEIDRSCDLALNPANREKINEYYDNQLKILENRVHCSLNFICQKKPDDAPAANLMSTRNNSRFTTETTSATTTTTNNNNLGQQQQQTQMNGAASMKMNDEQLEKLAQLILLKQMNEQKLASSTNNSSSATAHRVNQRRGVSSKILHSTTGQENGGKQKTKSLSGLKLNLMNQNNLLPSRRSISRTQQQPQMKSNVDTLMTMISQQQQQHQQNQFEQSKGHDELSDNDMELNQMTEKSESELFANTQDDESQFEDADYFFKRHLSLPYKCDKKPPVSLKRTSNYEIKNMVSQQQHQQSTSRKSRFATLDYSSSKTKYFGNGRSSTSSNDLSPSSSTSSLMMMMMRPSDQSDQFVRIKLNELSNQLSYNKAKTNSKTTSSHYLKNRFIQPKSLMYMLETSSSATASTTTASTTAASSMDTLNDDSFLASQQKLSSYAQIKKLNRSPSSSNVEADSDMSRRLEESPRSFKRYSSQFQVKGSALIQKKETQV